MKKCKSNVQGNRSSNRTLEELKYRDGLVFKSVTWTSNRTLEELKFGYCN